MDRVLDKVDVIDGRNIDLIMFVNYSVLASADTKRESARLMYSRENVRQSASTESPADAFCQVGPETESTRSTLRNYDAPFQVQFLTSVILQE